MINQKTVIKWKILLLIMLCLYQIHMLKIAFPGYKPKFTHTDTHTQK